MTVVVILVLAGLLGAVIVGCEATRNRDWLATDFMRVASAIYFIAFVVLPIYVTLVDLRAFPERTFDWMFKNRFGSEPFALASALALIAYAFVVLGYHAGMRRARRNSNGDRGGHAFADVLPRYLLATGIGLGLVGTLSLGLYIRDLGGVLIFLVSGVAARSGELQRESPLAFLKNLSHLTLGASYCFYALWKQPRARAARRAAFVALLVTGLLSVAAIFHSAGRVSLVTYLLAFGVAGAIQRGGVRPRTVFVGAVVFVFFVLFGRQIFLLAVDPKLIATQWSHLREDGALAVNTFLLEFVFPYVTAANTVVSVPDLSPYRWFVDLPLAFLYLVPQRLLGIRHPPTVSMVSTDLFGPLGGNIPVDLVSLGYFSGGVAGVLIVAFGFGWLLSVFERALPPSRDPLAAVLRSIWMFFLGFRVMYADPQQATATTTGFYLLLTTGLLLLPNLVGRVRWVPAVPDPPPARR